MTLLKKYMLTSSNIIKTIATIFQNRNIPFPIGDVTIQQSKSGLNWLLFNFNLSKLSKIDFLLEDDLIRHINLELNPYQLITVEDDIGIFYAICLDKKPTLSNVIFQENQIDNIFQVGRDLLGKEIVISWEDLGHIIVAGMTGSGKSVFLRSITEQSINDGFQLALIDLEDMTFGALKNNSNLVAPIGGIKTAEKVLNVVLDIIEERKEIFSSRKSIQDIYDWNNNLKDDDKPLPMILLAIDEFNATVQTFGGTKSNFANKATQIAWRGRKYGIIMVIAGQTFEKVIVGPVRDQMITKVCFQVSNAAISRIILGESGAEKINVPGRAITNRWGLIQTYYHENFDNQIIEDSVERKFSDFEIELLNTALEENNGKLTYSFIQNFGFSRTEAKEIRENLMRRGIAKIDKNQNNALVINIPQKQIKNGEVRKV